MSQLFRSRLRFHGYITTLVLILLLMLGSVNVVGASSRPLNPASPQFTSSSIAPRTSSPGAIYYGQVPPNSTGLPVLLFVHGLHGEASGWWSGNDMYNDAYNAGYRTAFVDLNGGGNMWTNGQILANQINTICAHYGVSSLNIVAHSKGGIDSQAAAVFYGAAPKVQIEFTLSTPNWGSQLADLSYSWWAGWLASIIGQHDDAVYSLQTGYMSYFRSITDNRSENALVHYDNTGGNSHGSIFGSLFYGGLYLDQYGENDGAVTVASAHNPNGDYIGTYGYDHYDIKQGHNMFGVVNSYVNGSWRVATAANALDVGLNNVAPLAERSPEFKQQTPMQDNLILRGGQLQATGATSVNIERGVEKVNFDLLTENKNLDVVVVAPSGKRYSRTAAGFHQKADNSEFFTGATHLSFAVNYPEAGTWHLEMTAPKGGKAAYLLMTDLQTKMHLKLDLGSAPKQTGSTVALNLSGTDGNGLALRNMQTKGKVSLAAKQPETRSTNALLEPNVQLDSSGKGTLQIPAQPGVYNVSLTVTGETVDGQPFERSLVTSFVATNGGKIDPANFSR